MKPDDDHKKKIGVFRSILELYELLTQKQKRRRVLLQCFILLMSFAEVLSVLSVANFLTITSEFEKISSNFLYLKLGRYIGEMSDKEFLTIVGIVTFLILICSTLISVFIGWKICSYGAGLGAELSSLLYRNYMGKTWLGHISVNSSDLTSNIFNECARLTGTIIHPLLQMNAKVIISLSMSIAMIIYDPWVASSILLSFGSAYFILFKIVRSKLFNNGKKISRLQEVRYRLLSEGFGGYKDLHVLGRKKNFIDRFEISSNHLAVAHATTQAFSTLPKYVMEFLAFGGVVILVLFLGLSDLDNLMGLLPTLSIFALAGLKLLPSIQNIYTSVAQIKGNLSAFHSLREDLMATQSDVDVNRDFVDEVEFNTPKKVISLVDVSFCYPNARRPQLMRLSMEIPVKGLIGIVGKSGSGKSTIVDILLGLIQPDKGYIALDGKKLTSSCITQWQHHIGFVPQSIFWQTRP